MKCAVIFFALSQIIFLQAQEYKVEIRSPSHKSPAQKSRVRRYSTDGLFGAQAQNVSSEQPENIATQNNRIVNFSTTGNSPRKSTTIPALTLNKFSPRCEFRKDTNGPIILPVIFEPTLQLVIDTISYKDNTEIFFKLMREQSLEAIITLYNFCYAYQVSTEYNTAVMNALLYDERFLKEIAENPDGNILKNHSHMFAWQNETEAIGFLSKYYMRHIIGDPFYEEQQEIALNARAEKIYWTHDCTQFIVVAGKNLRIFKVEEKKYHEVQTVSLIEMVHKIIWSNNGNRFIIQNASGMQQLYEYINGCFVRSSIELSPAEVDQKIYWDKPLESCIRKTPYNIYYEHYLKAKCESHLVVHSKIPIEKIFCDESLTHITALFDDLSIIKLYKREQGIFRSIVQKRLDGHDVNNVFVSPDTLTCVLEAQELDSKHVFVYTYPYPMTTMPFQDNPQIKQICWGEEKKYVALLNNNYSIQKYKYDGEGAYRESATIDCSCALETEILNIFTNADISKIIAHCRDNTLIVHQQVMTPEGLKYEKTEELRFQKQINQICCSKNLDTIVIRFENDVIEIMSCKNKAALSVNQILFFPALQKGNKTILGRAYIENNKKLLLDHIHSYQKMYGDWLIDVWSNVRIGYMSSTYNFFRKHTKICALLGVMAVVIPLSFIAGKYLTH